MLLSRLKYYKQWLRDSRRIPLGGGHESVDHWSTIVEHTIDEKHQIQEWKVADHEED
jgi:hypothetical protein